MMITRCDNNDDDDDHYGDNDSESEDITIMKLGE